MPEDWPKHGEIEFQNVSIRYETNFEPIIRDVNIHIKRGEKVKVTRCVPLTHWLFFLRRSACVAELAVESPR